MDILGYFIIGLCVIIFVAGVLFTVMSFADVVIAGGFNGS